MDKSKFLKKQAREWLPPTLVEVVIYHHPCMDGMGAAFAAEYGCYQELTYWKASYGGDPPWDLITDKYVLLVDFSYKRDVLLEMKQKAKRLIILDHHKSAEVDLEGIEGAFFDMNQSGATMAWRYFHDTPIPLFLRYIQDHDLKISSQFCEIIVSF